MRGAWYVVEAYFLLSLYHFVSHLSEGLADPMLLAILAGEFSLVLFLSWFTFRSKRLASRLLAIHIASSVVLYVWENEVRLSGFDVFRAYMLIMQAYLFLGAVKLWRIKELPTRFTDPPTPA